MNKYFTFLFLLSIFLAFSFKPARQKERKDANKSFAGFETRFLDAYWKQHPSLSINAGYGQYYDELIIPGSASVAKEIAFAGRWLD